MLLRVCLLLASLGGVWALYGNGVFRKSLLGPRTQLNLWSPRVSKATSSAADKTVSVDKDGVPVNGIIDYIGNTTSDGESRFRSLQWGGDVEGLGVPPPMRFRRPLPREALSNSVKFFFQLPWKKIGGRVVLRASIGGDLPLEKASRGGLSSLVSGKSESSEAVSSLEELTKLLVTSALDQRVVALFLEIQPLSCGYAKLTELKRAMAYFKSSGKKVYAFMTAGSEKELFVASFADTLIVPPEGGLDLRGFVGGAQFFRGIFDKIGVEPQVQRIGKYKSFGDTFNRTTLSEAQREVVSSLLMETSDFWAEAIAMEVGKGKKKEAVLNELWGSGSGTGGPRTPSEYLQLGYIDKVHYLDAAEALVLDECHSFGCYGTGLLPGFGAGNKSRRSFVWDLMFNDFDFQTHLATTRGRSWTSHYAGGGVQAMPEWEKEWVRDLNRSDVAAGLFHPNALATGRDKWASQLYSPSTDADDNNDDDDGNNEVVSTKTGEESGTGTGTGTPLPASLYPATRAAKREWAGNYDLDSDITSQPRRSLALANQWAEAEAAAVSPNATTISIAKLVNTTATTTVDPSLLPAYAASSPVVVTEPPRIPGARSSSRGGRSRGGNNPGVKLFPASLYLRKTRNLRLAGEPVRFTKKGNRVAIINAVGGIGPGESNTRPGSLSIGSDTLIAQLRRARQDPSIVAVVLRVDSPGGSALASDLCWRELRVLSRLKPVVASQVDVAASGGYYLSMGCDVIFSEETTVTGSIGVVTAKFNIAELAAKVGLNTEILSRGAMAEVLASTRGFTPAEEAYFAAGATKAYTSFITKAAASRGFESVDAMNTVAQGRVWTGKQALQRGLVDGNGGLWEAVWAASCLAKADQAAVEAASEAEEERRKAAGGGKSSWGFRKPWAQKKRKGSRSPQQREAARAKAQEEAEKVARGESAPANPEPLCVEVLRNYPKGGLSGLSLPGLGLGLAGLNTASVGGYSGLGSGSSSGEADVLMMLDDSIATMGLASPEALGVPASLLQLGVGPTQLASAGWVKRVLGALAGGGVGVLGGDRASQGAWGDFGRALEDAWDALFEEQ